MLTGIRNAGYSIQRFLRNHFTPIFLLKECSLYSGRKLSMGFPLRVEPEHCKLDKNACPYSLGIMDGYCERHEDYVGNLARIEA